MSKKKKTGKGKKFLRVLCVILCVIIVFAAASATASIVGDRANTKKALSFETVKKDDVIVPEKDEDGNWNFTTDREFKILQLTDVHIGGGWMSLKKDAMAINAVAAMVTAEKPDLIIITGDVAYPVPFQAGTFNNKSSAKIFADLMENLGIYWTLVFGNHDTEAYSYFSREKIADFYLDEKYEHCLFEKGPEDVDGVGNQIINIRNSKGLITRSLFLFDSHSYTDGDYLGIMWKYDNIHENQVKWYSESLDRLNAENNALLKSMGKKESSDIRSSAFFHIPLVEMKTAWDEYAANGYQDTADVKYVSGIAAESKKVIYCGCKEDDLFETMLDKGSTDSVFFGHDHLNDISFNYKGITMTYGKSVDYLAYPGIYKLGSQRGCTVITVAQDGGYSFEAQSYYQPKYVSQYEKEPVTMQDLTYPDPADLQPAETVPAG